MFCENFSLHQILEETFSTKGSNYMCGINLFLINKKCHLNWNQNQSLKAVSGESRMRDRVLYHRRCGLAHPQPQPSRLECAQYFVRKVFNAISVSAMRPSTANAEGYDRRFSFLE